MHFWATLKKPILCLAPMDDVTDVAFRNTIARYSKPHTPHYVSWTEFTSADGLVLADERGQQKLRAKLRFTEIERPIVAQLFSAVPEHMERAAHIVEDLGFDGVDINMGCPDRSVEKQGAGAALIRDPSHAQDIIAATKQGAKNLPVSVKTRLGYAQNEIEQWLPHILKMRPAAVTLHARTRNELSKVPAHWDAIAHAVRIRDAHISSDANQKICIIGNGDVQHIEEAYERVAETNCDGVMIGRGMFGNPWIMSNYTPTHEEKLQALIEHTKLFEESFHGIKSFAVMRKHFSSYVEGFPGAKELRNELMHAENAQEMESKVNTFLASTTDIA